MKNVLVVIIAIVLSSCCGTKKVTEKSSKTETKELAKAINPKTTEIIKEEPIEDIKPITQQETLKKLEVKKITVKNNVVPVEEKPKDSIIKNDGFHQDLKKRTLTNIHQMWDELLQKYVSTEGNVNYKGFKSDHTKLLDYIYVLSIFKSKGLVQSFSKEDKLAYWINAYNAMTVDLIIRNYPLKSIKDIKDPWDQRLWKLGSKWYNLDEIEHQILRKMNEPRIHFGIVCASFSCPKLQNEAFTASNLESQLTKATKEFLSDSQRNNISENNLKLSKIFKWFAKDFKQNGSLIDFIDTYSDINISSKAKKSFKDYNWDLNE